MGGKSTLMRQAGSLVIMAQVVSSLDIMALPMMYNKLCFGYLFISFY